MVKQMKRKDRKLAYSYVVGQLEGEGLTQDEASINKALRLNPVSPIERAMRAKTDKELQKIGEEVEEAQQAFNAGYFEGMPKRKTLNTYEKETLERLLRHKKHGTPDQQRSASIELEAFVAEKISQGVCPDILKGEK